MFAFGSWPASASVWKVPEQPCLAPRPWACSSWPSWMLSVTFEQSIVPSSGSVTGILYGTVSPKSANWPSSGMSILTVGRVLPATTTTVSTPDWPDWSVTVRRTLKLPAVVYVWVGLAAVESVVPLPSKSHAYVSDVPSGSTEPALENLTVNGTGPSVLSAEAWAIGLRAPLT